MLHTAAQVFVELELTSVTPARAFVPVVSGPPPGSRPPHGDESPATYWRERFAKASSEHEQRLAVDGARAELRRIRRRPFAVVEYDNADELAQRVIDEGEGFPIVDVAIALRCTPKFVRRARIAHECEPERGQRVALDELTPEALLEAGLSIRQVSAVVGVPRSTLAERLAR